ncbi:MAG: PDZ domain-containing protein [Bdellovibrionales bacterium]|nr:PDZ domain-containing protein [Bdellovibrionales bacterium]
MIKSLVIGLVLAFSASAQTNSQVLDEVWSVGRTKACSKDARARFNTTTLADLKSQLRSDTDRQALAQVLNPFLFSLGFSHTQFFTSDMESFYLFKGFHSLVTPSAPEPPLIVNPGVQVGTDDRGYFVRNVLHGSSADQAGVLKGDRILSVDDKAFSGSWGHQPKPKATASFGRQGKVYAADLLLPALNWAQAFQEATLKSIRIITNDSKKIGYVRLWSGVHPESADALWTAVNKFNAEAVDGVILDLRGGYGGAFWEHLDPFFANRKDYFVMTATDGDDTTVTLTPDPQANPDAYLGKMAVLIDEGSRSGKEALAYQFNKSKRATLIGTSTPGYFSGGGLFFLDQPKDYFLYLCVRRDSLLDGVEIEGIGVAPNLFVPFEINNKWQDSQLGHAVNLLAQ